MSDTGEASSAPHGGNASASARAAAAGTDAAAGLAELPPPSLTETGPGVKLRSTNERA